MARAFLSQVARCQKSKLFINDGCEVLKRPLVAVRPLRQQLGYLMGRGHTFGRGHLFGQCAILQRAEPEDERMIDFECRLRKYS
jgi:hypothetical protein